MTTQFYAHKLVRNARSFDEAIEALVEQRIARNKGHAIMLAHKHDPEGYNAWMSRRQRLAMQRT